MLNFVGSKIPFVIGAELLTTQIKVAFSYLIGEFRSFTEQSFHRQVHIKKVITSIKEGEVMMIMIMMIMIIIKVMIMIVIFFLVQG